MSTYRFVGGGMYELVNRILIRVVRKEASSDKKLEERLNSAEVKSEVRKQEVIRLNKAVERKEFLLREKIYQAGVYKKRIEGYEGKVERAEKKLSAAESNLELKTAIYEAKLKRENEGHTKDIEELNLLIAEQKKEIVHLRRYLRGITAIDYLKGNERVAVYNTSSLIGSADPVIEELRVLSRLSPNRRCSFNYLENGDNLRRAINSYDVIFLVHEGKSGHIIEEVRHDGKCRSAKVYCIDAREVQMGVPLVAIIREYKPYLRQTR